MKKWQGCLAPPPLLRTVPNRDVDLGKGEIKVHQGWHQNSIPTYSQEWPSCVGHATANLIEHLLRAWDKRAIPKGYQIDGDSFWRRARQMFWRGPDGDVRYNDGLLLHQAIEAAVDLGALPPGTEWKKVPPDLIDFSEALVKSPILQAHFVSDSWEHPAANGQIFAPMRFDPFTGGHATLALEIIPQGENFFVLSQNSWGADWGYFGYFLTAWLDWTRMYLDGGIQLELPPGWEKEEWAEFRGWEAFLIKTPKRR